MLIAGPVTGWITARHGSRAALLQGTVLVLGSFIFLAVWHSDPWMIYAVSFVSGLGIGFAFSAMPNLIIQAVEPTQTGVATGMNAIMRTVGGAIGGQVAAAVLTGYMTASGFPREAGYTVTFVLLAVALGLALVAVLAIPRPVPTAAAVPPVLDVPLLGRVHREGRVAAGAAVTVLGGNGREILHTRTGATGGFLVVLPPGRYVIVAGHAGRDHAALRVDLGDGRPVRLDLTPAHRAVEHSSPDRPMVRSGGLA